MKFTLNLTHRCNLNCRYCYSGRKFSKDMSLELAQKSVDFALGLAPQGETLEFSFFGGEPLLCFDLIKDITEKIYEKADAHGRPVRISLTTNGTLLSQGVLSFIKANNIDLCISLDGPRDVHDANRVYDGGMGSFDKVYENLKRAMEQLPQLQVNAVYSPENVIFMPDILSFFLCEGVPVVHFNPNISASWPQTALSHLGDVYHLLAEIYIQSYRLGREIAVNLLDSKIVLFLKKGYGPEDMCGMGRSELAVAPSGNIYPCERFIGEDNDPSFCIGHVAEGFNVERRCNILKARDNGDKSCAQCHLALYCMHWCGCTNYHMTGKIAQTAKMLCLSEQAAIREAGHVFTTLAHEDNDLFIDHLMHYVNEGCN